MDYFNGTDAHCGGAVGAMGSYVYNLTSSYADQKNEVSIVATSLTMLLLAALLLAFDLLAGAATLRPAARLVLSVSLALFLPVTSYLFSEAKNDVPGAGDATDAELPLRARLILAWMLLVELLRKKVEATVTGTKGASGGGPTSRAGRVAFLGYLVFFNVHGAGRKAVFGALWVVAAAKLVQRVAIGEFVKRSFAFGKNPQLLAGYMAQTLEQQERRPRRDDELMTSCKYAVMGEENLQREAGPNGYLVDLRKTVAGDDDAVVTVGRVWSLAESDQLLVSNPKLKRLCLSYALFKLLRREFEETPLTAAEAGDCRELIFRGLCNDGGAATAAATLFEVIDDELGFVTEYYHSVLPVMLASPFFLLVNYIVFPVLVLGLCLMTVVLCGNGYIAFIAGSIKRDNYAVSFGLLRMTRCLLSRAWELAVFLLSNWLTVSMVCDYAVKPPSRLRRAAIRGVQWVTNRMSRRNYLRVKQYSVLWFCRLPLKLPAAAVPEEAKQSIVEYLAAYDGAVAPLSAGRSAVAARNALCNASRLISSACESGSVAEVILTWHIATSLLEVRCPPHAEEEAAAAARSSTVATRLSRYCAYLVAFRREMLPDDVDCTARVYGAMTTELKRELGLKGYYFSTDATRYGKMMAIAGGQEDDEAAAEETTVVRKGARLGKALMDEAAGGDEAAVWKLVADVWTEIVVYVAPARDAEQVRAHGEALARGGEFVTVLWALVTHTGIARPAAASV
ncbi:hypothetical protein OsJ_19922 [Oryza sativa Japonica Group]|uniref:DUF4220 domain-containing protein n=1 Tax=Oryza sativa subsp. japonica TaxID=39947 RepID=B9FR86_ORYSJ|nr:hypothetical protein OsJ_19922 [Oryza sativa Japonica Group]